MAPIAITDPARLITSQSMMPFWIESRRRKGAIKAYDNMAHKLLDLLKEYQDKIWIHPAGIRSGIKICPNRWESNAADNIGKAYCDFEDAVGEALQAFEDSALGNLLELAAYLGISDAEIEAVRKSDRERLKEQARLDSIRSAYEIGLLQRIDPSYDPYEDFPF